MADRGPKGKPRLLGDQEAVGCDALSGVTMEAAPAASFVVTKPAPLLELLIVALVAPTQPGEVDEPLEADGLRQRGEPVFGRLCSFRPFDQRPLRQQLLGDRLDVPDTDARTCKARGQLVG